MSRTAVFVTTRNHPHRFVLDLIRQEASRTSGARVEVVESPYGPHIARNLSVASFLKGDDTHLLFVDDDVLVPAGVLVRLADHDVDVVAGCVPALKHIGGYAVPYIAVRDGMKSPGTWSTSWFDGLRETTGVGAACLLIRRQVLERLDFPWFRWEQEWNGGHYTYHTEDLDFCDRVRSLGFRIYADGAVRCGHIKQVDVGAMIPSTAGTHKITWNGPRIVEGATSH